jgi:hypothetical protein
MCALPVLSSCSHRTTSSSCSANGNGCPRRRRRPCPATRDQRSSSREPARPGRSRRRAGTAPAGESPRPPPARRGERGRSRCCSRRAPPAAPGEAATPGGPRLSATAPAAGAGGARSDGRTRPARPAARSFGDSAGRRPASDARRERAIRPRCPGDPTGPTGRCADDPACGRPAPASEAFTRSTPQGLPVRTSCSPG